LIAAPGLLLATLFFFLHSTAKVPPKFSLRLGAIATAIAALLGAPLCLFILAVSSGIVEGWDMRSGTMQSFIGALLPCVVGTSAVTAGVPILRRMRRLAIFPSGTSINNSNSVPSTSGVEKAVPKKRPSEVRLPEEIQDEIDTQVGTMDRQVKAHQKLLGKVEASLAELEKSKVAIYDLTSELRLVERVLRRRQPNGKIALYIKPTQNQAP
jgi:hypothetical protein